MRESGEMYLETLFVLKNRIGNVRAIDIAEEMNLSKPSVSKALSKLKEEACITVDESGYIDFTDKGKVIAVKIYERHELISKLLMEMGVSPETALLDACKMEHVISDETFEAIKKHAENVM